MGHMLHQHSSDTTRTGVWFKRDPARWPGRAEKILLAGGWTEGGWIITLCNLALGGRCSPSQKAGFRCYVRPFFSHNTLSTVRVGRAYGA
jgi:hypothetical protein